MTRHTAKQAIIVQSLKAPFVLGSTAIPSPAKGEVLVKIMAAALNPINWKEREFNVLIDEYPVVLGHDVAGVVEELGEGVDSFKRGDRVFAQILTGGFQQYATVLAAVLIPIPDNTSFDEVVTFPVTFTTACVGLLAPGPIGLGLDPTFSWDKPQQGESALVIGGATSVGQFAIQLLKFLGFTRIIVYASKTHFDYLKQLGATECIDRAEVPIDSLAAHPTLRTPVKVVYDIGSGPSLNAAYDCVAANGGIVTVQPMTPLERDVAAKNLVLVRVQGYYAGPDVMKFKRDNVAGYIVTPEHSTFGRLIIKNLPQMVEKRVISANRYEVLPNGVAGILEGLERMQKGSVRGIKLVAHPQDPTRA
ncbi:GroES-like protein [Mycena capillaripes]|nr:GroES-like protein [Mycena capillaripes]